MNDGTYSRLNEARAVAKGLLDKMETNSLPIEACLLQAKRLARLIRDTDAQTWLDLEIRGYPKKFDYKCLGNCLPYAKAGGRITEGGTYYSHSLPWFEAACAADKGILEKADIKPSAGTTYRMNLEHIEIVNDTKRNYLERVSLFSSIKASVHNYVSATLISIEFGDFAASIFDELRHEVDIFIREHCPESVEKLLAIAERMSETNAEAHAEALASCRRLLMSVADSVFPSSNKDWADKSGKKRKVREENYKNRILAFIESKIQSSTTVGLLENELEHLAARLDSVYDKSCKGVHADVSPNEARLTIIQAYIFIGEIARFTKVENQK